VADGSLFMKIDNIFMNYTAKIKKMHLIEKNYQHVKSLYY